MSDSVKTRVCRGIKLVTFIRAKLNWKQKSRKMTTVEEGPRSEGKPLAMSIREAASEAGVSEHTLYTLANKGHLPGCRRLGKRFVLHRSTFEEWLKSGMGDDSVR